MNKTSKTISTHQISTYCLLALLIVAALLLAACSPPEEQAKEEEASSLISQQLDDVQFDLDAATQAAQNRLEQACEDNPDC